MEYRSFPPSSIDASNYSARRRWVARRRGRSLNSSHVRNLERTLSRSSSTPKLTRRSGRRSNQSSVLNQSSASMNEKHEDVSISFPSSIVPSNPPDRSQLPSLLLPFDWPSDEEQHQNKKQNMGPTTRLGKMKKDAVLSYFILRSDGRYDCDTCHQVTSIFYWKIT